MNRYHPFFRLLSVVFPLIITMFCQTIAEGVLSFFGAMTAVFLVKSTRSAVRETIFSICLFALLTVTNPLFSHRGQTPLFFINDRPYTLEALLYGADLGLSLAAVIMWFGVVNSLLSKSDMLFLFGKAAPKLAMTVSMIMGYIPKIRLKFSEISRAQRGTGIFVSESRADKIAFGSTVFLAVTAWSAESSAETAQAMNARCYGYSKRSYAGRRKMRMTDIAMTAVLSLLWGFAIFAYAKGGRTEFYPAFSLPDGNLYTRGYVCAFAVIAFLPAFLLVKEKLKWKYLTARI